MQDTTTNRAEPTPKIENAADRYLENMRSACSLAEENVESNLGGPFGCVIVDLTTGNPICEGANSVVRTCDPTAHAEIVAIRRACEIRKTHVLADCVLISSCEPCPLCMSAIYWARIPKVFYANTRTDANKIGFDDEFIYDELGKPDHSMRKRVSVERLSGCGEERAFEAWRKSEEKRRY
jgi:guanine deaminase